MNKEFIIQYSDMKGIHTKMIKAPDKVKAKKSFTNLHGIARIISITEKP